MLENEEIEEPTIKPVKEIFRNLGSSINNLEKVSGSPHIMLITPLGNFASCKHCTKIIAEPGASIAGIRITEQPAAKAGAIFLEARTTGKFQEVNAATTPTGSC